MRELGGMVSLGVVRGVSYWVRWRSVDAVLDYWPTAPVWCVCAEGGPFEYTVGISLPLVAAAAAWGAGMAIPAPHILSLHTHLSKLADWVTI